ncbi:hypothetical protein PanWU01x14_294290 [Parasponia andersonii]|uniref:Retrovirus-related Pol polyprotein from transposon TNT 1-94-like beta-barrel domain-containing protein n=1 Tax=Parasponia andersonii TaxID=3476 RepID=A0A2P5AWC4_PARAD|nr:hypothetical protein PanWU01x14_294290 [Parasponia andersonii]
MSSMVATPNTLTDMSWYPNSGATNHLTPDINTLMTKQDYTGSDQIRTGNGTSMNISHIGQSSFYSRFSPTILTLNQRVHVPSITKSFLSVSKFATDNNVFCFF